MELKLLHSSLTRITHLKQLRTNALSTHVLVCTASLFMFIAISYTVYQQMSYDAHLDHDSFFYDNSARTMSGYELSEVTDNVSDSQSTDNSSRTNMNILDSRLRGNDARNSNVLSGKIADNWDDSASLTANSLDVPKNTHAPIQTIVYPCIVGLIYRFTHNNSAAVVIFQLLLALLSMLLTYSIAYLLCGRATAVCSLVLCCLNLGFITYTQLLLAEILLTFLLLLFFERWLVCLETRSYVHALQAGVALGFSLLVKPIALLVPIFLLLFAWWHKDRIKQFGLVLVLSALSYCLVGCYMVRNYVVHNAFALAPMMSLNVYQCYLSKVIGRLERRSSYEVAQTTLAFKADDPFDERGWHQARVLFYQTCINHPYTCASIWVENVSKTLFGLFATQFKQLFAGRNNPEHPHSFFWLTGSLYERFYAYISVGSSNRFIQAICFFEAFWSLGRWILVLGACWLFYRRQAYEALTLCCMFILVLAGMTGMDGCCRYRMTFEPILVILTAYSLCYGYQKASFIKFRTKITE